MSDTNTIPFGARPASSDWIGGVDRAVRAAFVPEHRDALLALKRERMEEYLGAVSTVPFTVLSSADGWAGLPATYADTLQESLEAGLGVNGFALDGRIYFMADNIGSLEQLRLTLVHEREHLLLADDESEALSDLFGQESMEKLLPAVCPEPEAYSHLHGAALARELDAFAMEVSYTVPEGTLADALRARGVNDERFIEYINERYNGQRKQDSLLEARRDAPVCERLSGGARRIPEAQVGGRPALGRQGAGPHDGSEEGPRGLTLAWLCSAQKLDGASYPTSEDLDADMLVPDTVAASVQLPLRITKQTLPVITKWFDRWFDSSYGKGLFKPVTDIVPSMAVTVDEDVKESSRKAFLDYIDTLEGNALQLATARWFCNGSIILPEDQYKVVSALAVASAQGVDPHRYVSPMALLDAFPGKVKGQPLDPDNYPDKLTNRRALANGVYVYDVPDGSRSLMREMINTHLGPKCSPWCLLYADKEGNLSPDSAGFWRNYSSVQKRAAFKEGADGVKRLVAFHASSDGRDTWWDTQDRPHDGAVPVFTRIPGDPGEKKVILYDQDSGAQLNTIEYLGQDESAAAARYESVMGSPWQGDSDDDLHYVESTYDRKGALVKVAFSQRCDESKAHFTTFYRNGQRHTLGRIVNNQKTGAYQSWHMNGQLRLDCTYISKKYFRRPYYAGDYRLYFSDGRVEKEGRFTENGQPVGEHREYHPDGTVKVSTVYDDRGTLVSRREYRADGSVSMIRDGDRTTTFYEAPKGEQAPVKSFAEDVRTAASLKKPEKEALTDTYYRSGALKTRTVVGPSLGVRKEYREDGSLKAEQFYRNWGMRTPLLLRLYSEDGRLDRFILDSYSTTVSVRLDEDGEVKEIAERDVYDGKMQKHGVCCTFFGANAHWSWFVRGEADPSKEAVMTRDEAMKALERHALVSVALGLVTDMPSVDGEVARTVIDKIAVAPMPDSMDDIPFRIEGQKAGRGVPVANVLSYFSLMNDTAQGRLLRSAGLESPASYGLRSNLELFNSAVDPHNREINISVEALSRIYDELLDFNMLFPDEGPAQGEDISRAEELFPVEGVDLSEEDEQLIMPDIRAERKAVEPSPSEAARVIPSRYCTNMIEKALPLVSERMEVLGGQHKEVWTEFSSRTGESFRPRGCARTVDGRVIKGADGAALNAMMLMRGSWLPYFITGEQMESMGIRPVCPNVMSYLLRGEAVAVRFEDGTPGEVIGVKRVFNIADTTLREERPEVWEALKKECAEMVKKDYGEKMYRNAEVCNAMKSRVLDTVLRRNSAFAACPDYIVTMIDTVMRTLLGYEDVRSAGAGMPMPDDLTAFRIGSAVDEALHEEMRSLYPSDGPTLGEMLSEAGRAVEKEEQRRQEQNVMLHEGQSESHGRKMR